MKKALVTSTSAVIFALIACVFDHISAVYTVGMYASIACLIAFVASLILMVRKEETAETSAKEYTPVKAASDKEAA